MSACKNVFINYQHETLIDTILLKITRAQPWKLAYFKV